MLWDKLSNFASNFTKLNNKLHKKMSKKNKQVEVNEFDETIAASKSFFEKYQKQIVYGVGSILTIIIAALLINQFYITPRNEKANVALFPAEQLFRSGQYDKAVAPVA